MIVYMEIDTWLSSRMDRKSNAISLKWVLAHWSDIQSASSAKLTTSMRTSINKKINKISTGKRREYKLAVLDIILYLSEGLQWSIPTPEKRVLQDEENKWYQSMRSESQSASHLNVIHQELLEDKVRSAFEVDSATIAISLLLETAPLSMASLFYILSHPDVLEVTEKYSNIYFPITLNVSDEINKYARYRLSPLCYRLLVNYYENINFPNSISELRTSIFNYLSFAPFYFQKITDQLLMKIVACHWDKKLPQFLLDDFINPNRQSAIKKERYFAINNTANKGVKKNNANSIFATSFKLSIKPIDNDKWPHKKLLAEHKKKGTKRLLEQLKDDDVVWNQDNILPQLYYFFLLELIEFGGVKKSNLENSTMETYTNGLKYLKQNPLSFECAMNEDDLNAWARSFYDNVESDNVRVYILYFLKFMAEYELTDALDIDAFKSVHRPGNTDANFVTAKEFQHILSLLAKEIPENSLQKKFSMLAAILGFHAGLRRGEIIRLRVFDVMPVRPKGNLFRIYIKNTKEGRTKNGKSRIVYMQLPEYQSQLLWTLLDFKKNVAWDEPLLCFAGEKSSVREQHYLLPVTRAIKVVCGERGRLHLLRHSFAFVSTNQLLTKFASFENTSDCPYVRELLQLDFIDKKFSYWFEGRPIEYINSQLALDQISEQIGHSHFETTRKSYLHGHEWLCGYFLEPRKIYSKAMLRYILGLKAGSNDISRRINSLLKNLPDCSQSNMHRSASLLITRVNEMALNINNQLSWLKEDIYDSIELNWKNVLEMNEVNKSISFFDVLIKGYIESTSEVNQISWQELSQIKLLLYRNNPPFHFTKPTLKLIKKWLINFNTDRNSFNVKCNQKIAAEYRKLFSLSEFKIFNCTFTLFKNKNTSSNKQEEFIRKAFFIRDEELSIEHIASGKSRLEVNLALKTFSIRKLIALYRNIFSLM